MTTPKHTPQETWDAIMKGADDAAEAEMDRIAALSEDELHAELAADGFDVAEQRAKGEQLVDELFAQREAEKDDAAGLEAERARIARIAPRLVKVPRTELEARLRKARVDPRLPAPIAVSFRNRDDAKATDDELRTLLAQIEAHIERAEET